MLVCDTSLLSNIYISTKLHEDAQMIPELSHKQEGLKK